MRKAPRNPRTLFPISYADLKDYQSRNQVFTSLAGFTSARGVTWQNQGVSEGMFAELVTGNYFSTLGLNPARGRFFAPEEDSIPGTHPVAVLNYVTWQKDFGGAEDIIGRQLSVNSVTLTIIGVAPPHFIGVNAIFGPNLWVPAAMAERLFPNSMQGALSDRGKAAFLAVGRLKPGVRGGAGAGQYCRHRQRVWPDIIRPPMPAIPQPCSRCATSSWPAPAAVPRRCCSPESRSPLWWESCC